ncbi:LSM domain protein [Staphylococcus marylandisciuri]|uniref:LSM domain protein n=1 Tax=Staphylococcus marylandisciuri TaxID=2981529 RepID=UPI003570D756
MRLWEYEGKQVEVCLNDGTILKGKVIDFDDKEDNVNGNDSILIKTIEGTFDIDESEMKSISFSTL